MDCISPCLNPHEVKVKLISHQSEILHFLDFKVSYANKRNADGNSMDVIIVLQVNVVLL